MPAPDPLSEAIAVMAELRGPDGCPWDREQTHTSLVKYAIEEAYEVAEAAEAGDPQDLREELGDLLLQVLFHAQIAAEAGTFTLEDVAATLVAKLKRRHPHVFGDVTAETAQEVAANWDAIKAQERPRAHPLAGIGESLPALVRAQKVISRATKAGLVPAAEPARTEEAVGEQLLQTVREAHAAQIDAEQALRGATRKFAGSMDPPT